MPLNATAIATLTPSPLAAEALLEAGEFVGLVAEHAMPTLRPAELFGRVCDAPHAFLLEGLSGPEGSLTRACIGLNPLAVLRADGRKVTLRERGETRTREADPIAALRDLLGAYRPANAAELPRFCGAVGFFGYDTVRHLERLPALAAEGLEMPEACWVIARDLAVFEPANGIMRLVTLVRREADESAAGALSRGTETLERLHRTLLGAMPERPRAATGLPAIAPGLAQAEFVAKVEILKEHIRAGDIFQVVLSHRFEATSPVAPYELYRALSAVNPSPYMYCLNLPEVAVVGSSPELLFRVEDGAISVRPIAGTRPRGLTPEADAAREAELRSDPKELAEHVMLVDLGRNDVGRVARLGSVRVVEQMVVERYSHVMHLVSEVQGELPEGQDAFAAFRATFPAGTLSGAPKVRAMELIETHEPQRRGLYGGAVGYFGFGGQADLAIAIRTILCQGDRKYFQTGAGIVHDSDPVAEYQETIQKAGALRRALELAHGVPADPEARDA